MRDSKIKNRSNEDLTSTSELEEDPKVVSDFESYIQVIARRMIILILLKKNFYPRKVDLSGTSFTKTIRRTQLQFVREKKTFR